MTEYLIERRMYNSVCSTGSAFPYTIVSFLYILIARSILIVIENARRIRRQMRGHDALAVTLGTAYSPLLIFLPLPSAPLPLRHGELGRGLVELFALGSHKCSVHAKS